MPPVIAAVIAAAGVTGGITIGATTVTYASILAYTITTAAALGASLLLGQQQKQKSDPQQVTVKQAMPARTRSYGRVKIGGAYAFIGVGGPGTLYQLVVHGQGEWDGIEEWWLNDKNAQLSGGAVGVFPWGSNIRIESFLGAPDQAASATLIERFPDIWTADHRLRGLAYSIVGYGWVQEKFFSKIYPNGAPVERVVARTARVLDPRSAAVAFSENPGPIIMDFLAHPDGLGMPLAMIDQASFAAFADLCDQAVPLAAGGSEPRYRVSLTYDLTQEPREVLRTLLQSCDAELYPAPDGKVAIRGGAWAAPTVTLGADHILSYQYEQGHDRLAAFNRLKLTFTDRNADYQPVEIDPWEDLASQAEVGVLQQDLTLTQVPSFTQARRLGKIASAKGNPRHRLTLRSNLAGLAALGERMVRVVLPELGLDEAFLIERFEVSGDLTGCDLTLSSLPESAYQWDSATEEGTPPSVPAQAPDPLAPPEPTGLDLDLERVEATAGLFLVRIRATVDEVAGQLWQMVGRYRKVGAADWLDMTSDGQWTAISDIVSDGGQYEVQAALSGYGGSAGVIGPWSDTATISTVADPTAPDLPSSFGVVGGTGSATLGWFNPTAANFYSVLIYRNTVNDLNTALVTQQLFGAPGQFMQHVDALAPGTYWWWIVATNRSDVHSAAVGPVSDDVA